MNWTRDKEEHICCLTERCKVDTCFWLILFKEEICKQTHSENIYLCVVNERECHTCIWSTSFFGARIFPPGLDLVFSVPKVATMP
jgi:hypothetical protein